MNDRRGRSSDVDFNNKQIHLVKEKCVYSLRINTIFLRRDTTTSENRESGDGVRYCVAKLRRRAQKETLAASTISGVIRGRDNFSVRKISLALHVGAWERSRTVSAGRYLRKIADRGRSVSA